MKDNAPNAPWWRHGHVWLLIAGPAAVVLAGLVTAWIAVHGQDPVVAEDTTVAASRSTRPWRPAVR